MALLKLNGWQRLWVVVSLLYLIAVVIFTIALMPKRSDRQQVWVSQTINAVRVVDKSVDYPYEVRNAFKDLSDDELVRRLQAKYSKAPYNLEFRSIDERHEKSLQDLSKDQAKSMGLGLLAWIVPSVVLYMLGWSIGWIYRGFQSRSASGS